MVCIAWSWWISTCRPSRRRLITTAPIIDTQVQGPIRQASTALPAAAADVEATIKSGGLAATKTKRIKVTDTCFHDICMHGAVCLQACMSACCIRRPERQQRAQHRSCLIDDAEDTRRAQLCTAYSRVQTVLPGCPG